MGLCAGASFSLLGRSGAVRGALWDDRVLARFDKPKAKFERSDLEAEEVSLDPVASDEILMRPLPDLDRPVARTKV